MNPGDIIWQEETDADGWLYGVMIQQPQLKGKIYECAFIRNICTDIQYLFYSGWGCDKEEISIEMLETVANNMNAAEATMSLIATPYDIFISSN